MTVDCYFELYHETFHIREDGENIFSHRGVQGPLDRLTRFSAVGENAAHGQCHSIRTELNSALSRPPRPPLHLVPAADEEASRRRQAVRPLHLPEMRLPTHNQARPKTTQPHALADCGKLFLQSRTSMACSSGTSLVYLVHLVCLVHLVSLVSLVYPFSLVQPNKRDKPDEPNKPTRQTEQTEQTKWTRQTGLLCEHPASAERLPA